MMLNKYFSSIQHNPDDPIEDHSNGIEDGDEIEGIDAGIDQTLAYELVQLRHQELQIKEEKLKCQKQMMLFKMKKTAALPVTKRRVLPNGQIQDITQDTETSITTGGGDSRHIPGLQRDHSRRCVSCDAHADLFCAGCRVTPYCGERCQRRDWERRHRAVCHNLARVPADDSVKPAAHSLPEIPATAPLRHPRSPVVSVRDPPLNDSGSEKEDVKFIPPAEKQAAHQQAQQRRANAIRSGTRNQCDERQNRNHASQNENRMEPRGGQEENAMKNQNASNRRHTPSQCPPLRQPLKPNPELKPIQVEPAPQVEVTKAKVEPNVVSDATPRKRLVPASYVVEKMPVGASFLAEAMALATDCGSKQAGFVCLTLHELYSAMYDQLCDEFKHECQKDTEEYTPTNRETFAYFCEEDSFWYRARCLARTRAALLDAGRVVSFTPQSSRRLPASYANIPEFMAVLKTNELTIGDNLNCTVVSVAPSGIRVRVETASGKSVEVDAMRWLPEVEYPAEPVAVPISPPEPTLAPISHPAPTAIPEVPRPSVHHNSMYVLLDVTSLRRACVRPCDPRLAATFDGVLQDTLLYAVTATPLKEPPQKGQTVVAKFIEDGTHYRAFVKRVNVALNKYLIEYIEYGNEEIVPLERLYPCPPKLTLDAKPAQASFIKLSDREPSTLTQAALKYIENLKDNAIELIMTLPGGAKHAPSGSLASLLVAKNCEPASKRIEELCTPEWQKLLESGGDVLGVTSPLYQDLKYLSVPTSRPFILRITFCDVETLAGGALSGYEKGDKSADLVYGELTKQIAEYCESPLCEEPYLPRLEELCITKNKRLNKWVRSVLAALPHGPGSKVASVLHVDYGDLEDVPVADIRKMMPEFVDQYPATAQHFEIKDFPHKKVTRPQLDRAMALMRITPEGEGVLRVTSCRAIEDNMYELEAPELIAALTQ